MTGIAMRIVSALLVFTFTATSVPSFGGQSLLAPQSRFRGASQQALKALLDASDEDVNTAFEYAINIMGPAKLTSELLRASADTDFIKDEISGTIRAIGAPAVPVLIVALEESEDPRIREAAAFSLADEHLLQVEGVIPALIKALRDSEENVRFSAAYSLEQRGVPAVSFLVDALIDTKTAFLASFVIEEIGAPAVPALVEAARARKDPLVKGCITDLLSSMGEPGITALLGLWDDPDPFMRKFVAEALNRGTGLGQKPEVPNLIEDLNSPIAGEKKNALLKIAMLGPQARQALPAVVQIFLGDPDIVMRNAAAIAIREMQPEPGQISQALIKALQDPNEEMRGIALHMLTRMNSKPPELIPHLAAIASNDPAEGIRSYAEKILSEMQPKGAAFKQVGVRRVLIIESDDNAREVLRGFVKTWRRGVKVETARNESEALDKIEAGSSFDVVFANYDNEGVDATRLAMSINRGRAIEEMTPVVLITRQDLEDLQSRIIRGIFAPLMKQGSLFDVIEKSFGQRHINDSLDAVDQFLNTRSNIEAAEAVINTLPWDAVTWADFEDIILLIRAEGAGIESYKLNEGGDRLKKELARRGVRSLDRAQFYPIASAFIKIKAEKYIKEMADRKVIDEKKKEALGRFLRYLLYRYESPGLMKYDTTEYYNILIKIGNYSPVTFGAARKVLKETYSNLNDDIIDQIAWRMRNICWFLREALGAEFDLGQKSASDQMTVVNYMHTALKYATGERLPDEDSIPPGSRRGGFALRKHLLAVSITALLAVAAGVRIVHDIRKEMGRRAYITQTRVILGLDKAEKGKEITIPDLIGYLKEKSGYKWIPANLRLKEMPETIPDLFTALEKGEISLSTTINILSNMKPEEAAPLLREALTDKRPIVQQAARTALKRMGRSGGFFSYKLSLAIVGAAVILLGANLYCALGMTAVPILLGNLHAAIRSDEPDDIVRAVWPLLDASRRRETASRAIVAVPILVNLISRKKSTPGVRRYVIYAIGKMCEKNIVNDPALAQALIDALLDEVPEVREAAAEALGKVYIDDKYKARAIQTLVYVSSPDNEKYWRVRLKAVEALGKIKDPAEGLVQLALEKAFGGDPQGTVRKKAGNAIAALSGVFEAGRIAAVAP